MKSSLLLGTRASIASSLFGLLLCVSPAFAAGPQMSAPTASITQVEDAQFAALRVTKVQPTLFTDAQQNLLVATLVEQTAATQLPAYQPIAQTDVDEASNGARAGLGFAGASTELDVVSLKYGYALGLVPILGDADPAMRQKHLELLDKMSKINGFYTPTLASHVEAFLQSARQGKIDYQAYMQIMSDAAQGIASSSDPAIERRHGYLLLGLWSSLAHISAQAGQVPAQIAQTGDALAAMLEKDASFGGSDLALAKEVRAITAVLAAEKPSPSLIQTHIAAMLEVAKDA